LSSYKLLSQQNRIAHEEEEEKEEEQNKERRGEVSAECGPESLSLHHAAKKEYKTKAGHQAYHRATI